MCIATHIDSYIENNHRDLDDLSKLNILAVANINTLASSYMRTVVK